MDMEYVRVTASLLAPRIRVRIRGRDTEHYVGILNREALIKRGEMAWGPIGGAASVAACPTFGRLVKDFGVSLWDEQSKEGKKDLRLRVPRVHLEQVLAELETQIPVWGEQDFRRELMQELGGRELHKVSKGSILPRDRVTRMDVRLVRVVRQPKNGGFVRSQRVEGDVPTKRLLFLYDLGMSHRSFKLLLAKPDVVREFNPADLPGTNDPPAEPIILEDGTERRGHLLRIDPPSP